MGGQGYSSVKSPRLVGALDFSRVSLSLSASPAPRPRFSAQIVPRQWIEGISSSEQVRSSIESTSVLARRMAATRRIAFTRASFDRSRHSARNRKRVISNRAKCPCLRTHGCARSCSCLFVSSASTPSYPHRATPYLASSPTLRLRCAHRHNRAASVDADHLPAIGRFVGHVCQRFALLKGGLRDLLRDLWIVHALADDAL